MTKLKIVGGFIATEKGAPITPEMKQRVVMTYNSHDKLVAELTDTREQLAALQHNNVIVAMRNLLAENARMRDALKAIKTIIAEANTMPMIDAALENKTA